MPLKPSEIVLVNDNSFIQTPHVGSGYCRTKTNIYRVRKSREKYIELVNKGFYLWQDHGPSDHQCKQLKRVQ